MRPHIDPFSKLTGVDSVMGGGLVLGFYWLHSVQIHSIHQPRNCLWTAEITGEWEFSIGQITSGWDFKTSNNLSMEFSKNQITTRRDLK